MTKDQITHIAREAGFVGMDGDHGALRRFANLVAEQQREEDAKLVESITLEWPDQPEFAQVERTTIQDCAKMYCSAPGTKRD